MPKYTARIYAEGFERWKQNGKGENYRKGLEKLWHPAWTPEHAAEVAKQYDRTLALVIAYQQTLPENERKNVYEHLHKHAAKLGLGRENGVLQGLAELGVDRLINYIPDSKAFPGISSIPAAAAGEAVKRGGGRQSIDIQGQSD